VVETAVFEHRLTPMLHLNDVVTVFDGLCVESDVTMLRLAEIQGRHCAGLMAPMMEGAETVSDALKVLLTFNCLHAQPIYWTPSVRGDHVAFAIWVDRPAEVSVRQSEQMAAMGMLQFVLVSEICLATVLSQRSCALSPLRSAPTGRVSLWAYPSSAAQPKPRY
jgi:hypothetical protein